MLERAWRSPSTKLAQSSRKNLHFVAMFTYFPVFRAATPMSKYQHQQGTRPGSSSHGLNALLSASVGSAGALNLSAYYIVQPQEVPQI